MVLSLSLLLLLLLSAPASFPASSAAHALNVPKRQFRIIRRAGVSPVDQEGVRVWAANLSASDSIRVQTHAAAVGNARPSQVMAAAAATLARRRQRMRDRVQGRQQVDSSILYHGGGVMTAPMPVFIVFYGSWTNRQRGLVLSFINSLTNDSSTPKTGSSLFKWWKISTQYTQRGGQHVTKKVWVQKWVSDNYSLGTYLQNDMSDIFSIVARQLRAGTFPLLRDAVYLVLSSGDVSAGDPTNGFCGFNGYCGFHSIVSVTSPAMNIKYGFIGNGAQKCGYGCARSLHRSATPHSDLGVDGMMSVIAHEISETATNPLLNYGWFDSEGEECADKCSTYFGSKAEIKLDTGYAYNALGQGSNRWLVQTNWTPLGNQGCVLQG